MIQVEKVSFWYDRNLQPVLNEISLTVNEGESVCIMGANGSGKSTLARILADLLSPAEGQLTITHPNGLPEDSLRQVGILFQNPDNQMVAMVVEKELAFALENQGMPMPEMEERVSEALRSMQITQLRRRLTNELSGGEKQRVALAAVMIQNPPILVLDEPDSFLDEAGRKLLKHELAVLRELTPDLIEIRITQYPHVARTYPDCPARRFYCRR
jgi:energy-coupling factor transporter ATP-binding protein EcfA2